MTDPAKQEVIRAVAIRSVPIASGTDLQPSCALRRLT